MLTRTPPDLLSGLPAQVPRRFWEDLKLSMRKLYVETHALSKGLHPQLAANYRGHRLTQFGQQVLLDVARKYGLNAVVKETVPKGYHYTVVRSGLYVFTSHYSPSPGALIRPAGYKNTLARFPTLFAEIDALAQGDGYYAAVLHYPQFQYTPEFRVDFKGVNVGFPDARCERYVHLFDPLSVYRLDSVSADAEHVADDAVPQLRRAAKSDNT